MRAHVVQPGSMMATLGAPGAFPDGADAGTEAHAIDAGEPPCVTVEVGMQYTLSVGRSAAIIAAMASVASGYQFVSAWRFVGSTSIHVFFPRACPASTMVLSLPPVQKSMVAASVAGAADAVPGFLERVMADCEFVECVVYTDGNVFF